LGGRRNAAKPCEEVELAALVQFEEGQEIAQRIPEAIFLRGLHRKGLRLPCQMAIDAEIDGNTRPPHQLLRRGETGIDLDDLQLAVARVALELDIAEAPEPHGIEKFLAGRRGFWKPAGFVVASVTAIERPAP